MNLIKPITLFPFILLCCLTFPGSSSADLLPPHKPLKILLICGHAVDCEEAKATLREVEEIYKKQFGLRFDLLASYNIPHDMSGSVAERLNKWQFIASEFINEHQPEVTIFAISELPSSLPIIDFEIEQVAGAANGICVRSEAALFSKQMISRAFSSKILAHELGHILGAPHTEAGIMASSLQRAQLSELFSLESVEAIGQCLLSRWYG